MNAPANVTVPRQPTRDGARPVIQYIESELPRCVTQACQAAVDAAAPIYARGTSLVRPVHIATTTHANDVRRIEGATVLVPVDKAALVEIFTTLIDWKKWDMRKDDLRSIACPSIVAETALARRGDWPFPQLRAVVSAPTLRPDGTILSNKGFDTQTGILFVSELEWPILSDQPSKRDAQAAMGVLRGLLESFPFVGPADRSAALAMILTALVRPCLPTAPLFGVNAPTPGTGKSKLVDLAAILATGQAAAVLSAPREEAELQKHVGSVLMAGDAFITLDNIEYPLRSEFLCQVLTQGAVAVRVLGESRTLKLPTGSTFCATGNSLRFAGDLTRRVVLINLDARVERPEDRVFKTDVTATAKTRRIELVSAALTVLRAFVVQRGQRIAPPLGSFEDWSNLVRSALVWIGEADPLLNAGKVRDDDPERERTAAILNALPIGDPWTVGKISRMIDLDLEQHPSQRRHDVLIDALGEFIQRGALNKQRLGHFLRKQAGRIVGGKRLVSCGHDRTNAATWTVEAV
ncbi:putative DNA primase/helicase [Mesorhizobium albiziae]|uniref:Putative DNA primase/helicase n=1 Tax=Neomesorhizobium albiziae TaxID=335020 RepID=A0A1I3XD75_9HYPH|nr:hypothetical protein [Mesorhizobium albiziae]GLS30560.1 hypothetical protein GCM10007937_22680 [Mesorhizobium albiziae]SFK17021.1 putative DNA primase/helicase [Mesorhizobium albiziae]